MYVDISTNCPSDILRIFQTVFKYLKYIFRAIVGRWCYTNCLAPLNLVSMSSQCSHTLLYFYSHLCTGRFLKNLPNKNIQLYNILLEAKVRFQSQIIHIYVLVYLLNCLWYFVYLNKRSSLTISGLHDWATPVFSANNKRPECLIYKITTIIHRSARMTSQ